MKGILVVLTAGALGNMIDRMFHGYVIDFLYFKLINFPIFNVADCYVCISAFLFFLAIMFYYKDGDFRFLIPGKGRKA
jgi:signal peptidase II